MNETTQDILVAYDGSADADLALQWAAQTARLEHRRMSVVVIDDSHPQTGRGWWPEEYWTEIEEQAAKVLAEAGVDDAQVRRARGRLVPTLIALAHDASLLVLGSRGHSRAGELFMGSVSQHLARHAPCPVAVVRAPESTDAGRIVVGLDGSPASEDALIFACRRAQTTGEKVSAVRAADAGPVPLDRKGRLPATLGTFLEDQEERLDRSVAAAAAAYPDLEIEAEFIALSPAVALAGTSRHASLVVVGSRGLNAFTGMLLGSVSDGVLRQAHCPVVVVR